MVMKKSAKKAVKKSAKKAVKKSAKRSGLGGGGSPPKSRQFGIRYRVRLGGEDPDSRDGS